MRRGGLRAGECAEFTAQIAATGKQPSVTSVLPLPVTPGRCPLAFPRLSGTESPTPTLLRACLKWKRFMWLRSLCFPAVLSSRLLPHTGMRMVIPVSGPQTGAGSKPLVVPYSSGRGAAWGSTWILQNTPWFPLTLLVSLCILCSLVVPFSL